MFKYKNASSIGLFLATFAWGFSFYLVQGAIAQVGIWPFLVYRFSLAFIVLALVFPTKIFRSDFNSVSRGFVLGFFLFLATWTQTEGLLYTSIGRSGFITALYVPLTPFFSWILFRKKISATNCLLVCVAMAGLYFLTIKTPSIPGDSFFKGLNRGDLWTLGTALFYSLHIVLTEKITRLEPDSVKLGLWQFFWCMVFILISGNWVGTSRGSGNWDVLHWPQISIISLFFNAIITTDFAFMMQLICQKSVNALKAALIFALEAPFAALFAYLMLGQILTLREVIGAALVFLASIVPERWLNRSFWRNKHGAF